MRASPLFMLVTIAGGCSLSPPGPGSADILGQVIQSSGFPLANSSVAIDCGPGTMKKQVATDSAGRYHVNLSAPTAGRFRCAFGAPDLVAPRARVDTLVRFSPNGQLHALQFVDLWETTTP